MKIYIAADHNGFELRKTLAKYLANNGHTVIETGDTEYDPVDDYPVIAKRLAVEMLAGKDKHARGILICGSGQGVCIAANRSRGIRALLGYDNESVRSARNDDDANVLCLPARTISNSVAISLVNTFLNTEFAEAPRFIRRRNELDNLD